MKADLHVHSEYSWDSKVSIKKYIKLAEEKDFGAISITDHNSIESHGEIEKLQEQTKVILVPGQEINTLNGHLLVYGWIDLVPRDLSMKEAIKVAKQQGKEKGEKVICVAAHPFDRFRSGGGEDALKSGIDGLETLNASALFEFVNKKAVKYAKDKDLICIGNSDCHRSSEFGLAFNELAICNTVEDVLDALKDGIVKGKRIGWRRKIARFTRRKLGMMTD